MTDRLLTKREAACFWKNLSSRNSPVLKNSLVLQGRPAKRRSLTLHQIRGSASGGFSEILTIGGVDDST